jgi:ABC-type dipeptide/oligopeptide/nickel transport system permease subunit
VLVLVVFVAVFADIVDRYDPITQNTTEAFAKPSTKHWLGADHLGRDTYSRIVHGSRTALLVGLLSVGIGAAAGVPIGLYAGYRKGWVDELLMRTMDSVYAFPGILLALTVIAALGPGMINVSIAIGVTFIPPFSRIVRASTFTVMAEDYVAAAQAIGAAPHRIIGRHVFPNVLAPLIVQISLGLAFAITAEASLSFLGLGTQPPNPSWGLMLQSAQRYLYSNPGTAFYPGIAIVVTVLAWNLLGDALRDVLDPRLRGR